MNIYYKPRYDLIIVICISLLAYWLHSLAWPLHPGRDWDDYVRLFTLISDGNLLQKLSLRDWGMLGPSISHRLPVTPLLTGFVFILGGPILLEISLSLAFCFVNVAAFTIGSYWGRIVGVISVILLCLSQPYIYLFHQTSSDALYATFLMLFFFAGFRFLHSQKFQTTIVIGLITFLVYFTRPSGQILFIFWPLILVLLGSFGLKYFIRHTLIFSFTCSVLLLCWATFFFITVDSFKINFSGPLYLITKVHVEDQIFYPENGPASMEISQIIKKNIEEGKYKNDVDRRTGHSINDFETFRTAGVSSLRYLYMAPRTRYSTETSNRLIQKAAVEAIIAHPRRYLRGAIRSFHESFLFGEIIDYGHNTNAYAKTKAKVRKGLDVSTEEKMLALPIRNGNHQLRALLDSYILPNLYFWVVAGIGIFVGTIRPAEIVLAGYLCLSLCHICLLALMVGPLYQYRAPLDPIFIVIGVVGLSKTFSAIKKRDYGAFRRLFRIVYITVFLATLIALPLLLLHGSSSPSLLGRYSTSLMFILSFDIVILVGLILAFVGKQRAFRLCRTDNIESDRFHLAIRNYDYISASLVICFLTIWFPLAYSLLIDNL